MTDVSSPSLSPTSASPSPSDAAPLDPLPDSPTLSPTPLPVPSCPLPPGFVLCDGCEEAIPKTSVAQHESTLCSQALADCLLSRHHHDLCHLHPPGKGEDGEEGEEGGEELTREEVSRHIEGKVGLHVLYLMDLVDRLQHSLTSLTADLHTERRLRLEAERQMQEVITTLAQKVDHAQVAHFTAPSPYSHSSSYPSPYPNASSSPYPSSYTPALRTTSGRVIQRRIDAADPFTSIRSSIEYPPARPPSPPTPALTPSPSAWQPKRPTPTASDPSLDLPTDPAALIKRIHSTLNKLTPTTFDRLSQNLLRLYQSIGEAAVLSHCTTHLYEKALADIFFGRMYAELAHVLSGGVKEGPEGGKGFRYYLLNTCQVEFEKGTLHVKRKTEEVKEEGLRGEGEEAGEEEKRQEGAEGEDEDGEVGVDTGGEGLVVSAEVASKRRMIANVRFIGELFLCEEIPAPIMIACVKQLLAQVELEASVHSEDSIQGLCKLLMTVGGKLDGAVGGEVMTGIWEAVRRESGAEGKHSNRGKFALLDLIEARQKGWKEREGQKGQSASGGKIEQVGAGEAGGGGSKGSSTVIRVGFSGVEYEGGRGQGHGGGGGYGSGGGGHGAGGGHGGGAGGSGNGRGEGEKERRLDREKERERERELIPHLTANERMSQASAMASSVTKWQPGVKKKVVTLANPP